MDSDGLKHRTKAFGLRIIRLVDSLPNRSVARVLGRQLLRSGTSVGANYRAACRARSRAEFVAKLGIVEEEADETLYWIEMLTEAELVNPKRVSDLHKEADEILSIVITSIRTARRHAK